MKTSNKSLLVFLMVAFLLMAGSGLFKATVSADLSTLQKLKARLESRKRDLSKKLADLQALTIANKLTFTTESKLFTFSKVFPNVSIAEGHHSYYVLRIQLVTNTIREANLVVKIARLFLCPSPQEKTCVFVSSLNPFELMVFVREEGS